MRQYEIVAARVVQYLKQEWNNVMFRQATRHEGVLVPQAMCRKTFQIRTASPD